MIKKIVFTGGGTAGHVTPNLALIEALIKQDWQVDYIGSKDSIEKTLVEQKKIPFHAIETGKLRRYFSWKNALSPFLICAGIMQSYFLLRKLKPNIVFSKGGFVAFPVVFSAWLNRIPIVAHESDLSPGLANRLSFPFVNKICLTFANAKPFFKQSQHTVTTGTPIRQRLFEGSKQQGLQLCQFTEDKPCILVMGGSAGSAKINLIVRQALPALLPLYNIIHLCGTGKIDPLSVYPGYYQIEYANDSLPDLLAAADIVVSRAGANSIYELLALQKPHILIPLSAEVSRGDQIENAQYFKDLGVSAVINDESLVQEQLITELATILASRNQIIKNIQALSIKSATDEVIKVIHNQMSCKVNSPRD